MLLSLKKEAEIISLLPLLVASPLSHVPLFHSFQRDVAAGIRKGARDVCLFLQRLRFCRRLKAAGPNFNGSMVTWPH